MRVSAGTSACVGAGGGAVCVHGVQACLRRPWRPSGKTCPAGASWRTRASPGPMCRHRAPTAQGKSGTHPRCRTRCAGPAAAAACTSSPSAATRDAPLRSKGSSRSSGSVSRLPCAERGGVAPSSLLPRLATHCGTAHPPRPAAAGLPAAGANAAGARRHGAWTASIATASRIGTATTRSATSTTTGRSAPLAASTTPVRRLPPPPPLPAAARTV